MCEVIVEYKNKNSIDKIKKFAKIKKHFPLINSYEIEIDLKNLEKIKTIDGLEVYSYNTHITAQMENTKNTIKCTKEIREKYTGKNVTVAILDTGISMIEDFLIPRNRVLKFVDFTDNKKMPYDDNGHGTHISGILGGNGFLSDGKYSGIAPDVNIISLKTLNSEGTGDLSNVLSALQWVYNNRYKYNIKIVNLSIGTEYKNKNDPLVRAVENLWDAGITIVTAAGNNGPREYSITSPGISKKVITVGACDDDVKVRIWGNNLVNFSSRGPTYDCIVKPDVVAPGREIISCLSKERKDIEEEVIDRNYIKLSGTSMSTPIVTGAIALLLEKNPELSPNEIKYKLKFSTDSLNLPNNRQGWGLLNIEKLLKEG